MWNVKCDTWHVSCDMWHVTCDTWTISQNFSSLAVWERHCFENIFTEDDSPWVDELQRFFRTIPATYHEGHAILFFFNKYDDYDNNNEDDDFINEKDVDELKLLTMKGMTYGSIFVIMMMMRKRRTKTNLKLMMFLMMFMMMMMTMTFMGICLCVLPYCIIPYIWQYGICDYAFSTKCSTNCGAQIIQDKMYITKGAGQSL